MSKGRKVQGSRIATQRRFIAEMRAMQPDAVMSERLNELERQLDKAEGKQPAAV